jgi:ABC-type multidrug transport system fused ATPase/permease subunit
MFEFRRVFRSLSLADRYRLILFFTLRVFLVGFDIAGLIFVGIVMSLFSGTVVSSDSSLGWLLGILAGLGLGNGLVAIGLIAVSFFAAKGLISILFTSWYGRFLSRLELSQSKAVFSQILNLDAARQHKFSAPELLHAAGPSTYADITLRLSLLSTIWSELALLVAVAVFLAITNFTLFLAASLFFVGVGLLMLRLIGRAAASNYQIMTKAILSGHDSVLAALQNSRQIRVLRKQPGFLKSFSVHRSNSSNASAKALTLATLPRVITELAVMVAAGVLLSLRTSPEPEAVPIETLAIFLTGIFRIVSSMLPLQAALSGLKHVEEEARASKMIMSFYVEPAGWPDEDMSSAPAGGSPPSVEFRNVVFTHPDEVDMTIHDATFTVEGGQLAMLSGKSGSGKSTIADLLLGVKVPDKGAILIDGKTSGTYLASSSVRTAYVPQQTFLFGGTLLQNILLDPSYHGAPHNEVWDAVDKAFLRGLVDSLEDGLDTVLGPEGAGLSGGEVQRIGLARAFLKDPMLLVLDESTSALDGEAENHIFQTLKAMRGRCTIIFIAHKPAVAEFSDVIVMASNGVVSQSNVPE